MNSKYREKVDIVCKNLTSKQKSIDDKTIIRHAYLRELASVIPCIHDISQDVPERLHNEYKNIKHQNKLKLFNGEKEVLCLYIAEELSKRMGEMSFDCFIQERSVRPYRICYVKNHFSDIAYRIFDKALGGITSEYADSFDHAAQSVFYENCSGCILPYESEDGGVMPGIKAIADKYDLNKSYVCIVDTGGQPTKFVLFTRGLWIDDKANKIEFTVNTESFFDCSDIIAAGKIFGFSDGQMISTTFGNKYHRNSTFTFTGTKHEMAILMLYLFLEHERSNISGIYREIK